MNDKSIIGGIIVLLLAIGVMLYATNGSGVTPKESQTVTASIEGVQFAQCLSEKNAVFYGAFWCPHCLAQKALFGSAVSEIKYVECSTPDGNSQLAVCKAKGVQSYPTWIFADGTLVTGEQSFSSLAEKTGCTDPTPGAVSGTTSDTTTSPKIPAEQTPPELVI